MLFDNQEIPKIKISDKIPYMTTEEINIITGMENDIFLDYNKI